MTAAAAPMHRAGRRRLASALLAIALTTAAGCGAPSDPTAIAAARSHIDVLAGRIGPRPHGSEAAAHAREYIADTLRQIGFDVRTQRARAVNQAAGLSADVANVIAVKPGDRPDAIALISHYDSHPESPGALDDALGVAVSIEAARRLAAAPMRHTVMVIVTDAEEIGLMGARAVVQDADVAARVRAFLNFDGTGAAGPGLLFEAGPGSGAPLDAWAVAPQPAGASFSTEIYRRLPNDTDFTIFRRTGAYGLNFAPVGDSYAYHTSRDLPARVRDATLGQAIANAVAIVRALDAGVGAGDAADRPTWFTAAGRGIVYGATTAGTVLIAAVVAGLVGWFRLTVSAWRGHGVWRLVRTVVCAAIVAGAGVMAMLGAVTLLRATRAELHPWYASPHWFLAWLVVSGATAGWMLRRLAWRLPQRWQVWHGPAAVWWLALPLWIACAVALGIVAPVASYLVAWPLIVAGLGVASAGDRVVGLRIVSAIALAVVATLWLQDAVRLLAFVVTLLGWMPVVAPAATYPALITTFAVMLALPFAALVSRSVSPGSPFLRSVRAPAAAVLILGLLAWFSPAYTWDRPHRRAVRYVQDDIARAAWWEVAGNEPSADLLAGAPEGPWEAVELAPPASVALGPLERPWRFRTAARASLLPPPADVTAVLTPLGADAGGAWRYDVTVAARALVNVRLVLPNDLEPLSSSHAGVVRAGRFMATHTGVSAPGVTMSFTVREADGARLREAAAVLTTSSLPGAAGASALPAWLPADTTAWTVRSSYVVAIPLSVVPGPPVR